MQGAEHVLDSSSKDFFKQQLTLISHKLKATWAADAVAGSLTGVLAASMPLGSTISVYGVLSGEESKLNPGDLIFRGQTVTGFWLSNEFRDHSPLGLIRIALRLKNATKLLANDLQTKAQAHVKLGEMTERLSGLLTSTSKGKIYITPNA